MKTRRIVVLIALFSLLLMTQLAMRLVAKTALAPMVSNGGQTGFGILADEINSIANSVNWSDGNYRVQHTGVVFDRITTPIYYLQGIAADDILITRLNEVDGFGLGNISALLNTFPAILLLHLPDTRGNNYWSMYDRFAYNLYRWAVNTSYASKWSFSGALNDMHALIATNQDLALEYGYDKYMQYGRYYDEYAETMDAFLGLGDLNFAKQIWEWDYHDHWNGQYWNYNPGSGLVECEAGPFAMLVAKLYVKSGEYVPYFDTVGEDLSYKFLADNWSSPLWGGQYVCTHAGDGRLRLENTEATFAALQIYYPYLNATEKVNFVDMLTGTGYNSTAWQYLLQSQLYQAPEFRFEYPYLPAADSTAIQLTDEATAVGLKTLFLQGIIPVSGSLAIPLIEESYEDTETYMPATLFRFDYDGHSIRIPVNAGELEFQFGSGITSWTFPSNGIYYVQFSNDWNTITNVTKVSELSTDFPCLPQVLSNENETMTILIRHFNEKPTSPNWVPSLDLNNDGVVNMRDIAIAVLHFTEQN